MKQAFTRLLTAGSLSWAVASLGCATSTDGTSSTTETTSGGSAGTTLSFVDPAGDDNGPGTYTYPSSPEYTRGSFDLRKFEIQDAGDVFRVRLTVGQKILDPWDSKAWGGQGWSMQMAFVHIDTDHTAGSGEQLGLPGTNVRFNGDEAWDKVIIISPQGAARLNSEIEQKAAKFADRIIIPKRVLVRGKTLVAEIPKSALGEIQPQWGWQVLMQSNEGYPDGQDLLTRRVNEYGGDHRFGGGTDYDVDPHVLDMLAGQAQGEATEVEAQHKALSAYKADAIDASPDDLVVVPMVYRQAGDEG